MEVNSDQAIDRNIHFTGKGKIMPSISGLKLSIGAGSTSSKRKVTVTYKISFSSGEVMDNSVFTERVTLRGDDPVWDDHQKTILSQYTRAQSGGIDRAIVREVSKSVLDEDPDTIILGFVIGNRDEIYARVAFTPFNPSGKQRDSNIIKRHFGQASN